MSKQPKTKKERQLLRLQEREREKEEQRIRGLPPHRDKMVRKPPVAK